MVRLAHAEALAQTGARDEARRALAVAHERLLARAERIEEPAWRHRFLHDVPVNARILALVEEWRAPVASGAGGRGSRRRASTPRPRAARPTGSNALA